MDLPRIGVFDSGLGGLTVVREVFTQLPNCAVVYFGDTSRLPYGSRSPEELCRFALEITTFLVAQGVSLVIDACNSTSAVALELLKASFPLPIVGVVEPGVRAALRATRRKKIGIIATAATVKSKAHLRLFAQLAPEVEVYAQACPLFVPLVEAGLGNSPLALEVARQYLLPLKEKGIDTLLLGCTHYPFLEQVLRKVLGEEVAFVDPAAETVREAKEELVRLGLLENNPGVKGHLFYVSGDPESFRENASRLLGFSLERVTQVNLEEFLLTKKK